MQCISEDNHLQKVLQVHDAVTGEVDFEDIDEGRESCLLLFLGNIPQL